MFVLGDSRDESSDSRTFGPVPTDRVLGRARAVAFSFDRSTGLRWRSERLFAPLDGAAEQAASRSTRAGGSSSSEAGR